jgi:hypothetical protein
MFFYIFHHINHYLFKPADKTDAAINVRTLIMGGIAYILFHGFLYSKNMREYYFKDYFWWIFALDVCSVSVIYRSYYGESILGEIGKTFGKCRSANDLNDKSPLLPEGVGSAGSTSLEAYVSLNPKDCERPLGTSLNGKCHYVSKLQDKNKDTPVEPKQEVQPTQIVELPKLIN